MVKFSEESIYTMLISSSSLSAVCSAFIAFSVIRKIKNGMSSPSRRIILCLSLSDVIKSVSLLLGPFMVPRSHPGGIWAIGNNKTCETQAFVYAYGSIMLPLYMALLCFYTVCKVERRLSDDSFYQRFEKRIHISIIAGSLMLCILMLFIADVGAVYKGYTCRLAVITPVGCKQRPDIVGECNSENELSTMFRLIQHVLIPVTSFFIIIICMIKICRHRSPAQSVIVQPANHQKSGPAGGNEDEESLHADHHIYRRGEESQEQTSHPAMLLERKRVKELIVQALWFVSAFFLPNVMGWIVMIHLYIYSKLLSDKLLLSVAIMYPLEGFFYFLAYIRPKCLVVQLKKPDYSWFQVFWCVIKAGGDLPKSLQPNNATRTREEGAGEQQVLGGERSSSSGVLSPAVNLYVSSSGAAHAEDSSLEEIEVGYRNESQWEYVQGVLIGLEKIVEEEQSEQDEDDDEDEEQKKDDGNDFSENETTTRFALSQQEAEEDTNPVDRAYKRALSRIKDM